MVFSPGRRSEAGEKADGGSGAKKATESQANLRREGAELLLEVRGGGGGELQ